MTSIVSGNVGYEMPHPKTFCFLALHSQLPLTVYIYTVRGYILSQYISVSIYPGILYKHSIVSFKMICKVKMICKAGFKNF